MSGWALGWLVVGVAPHVLADQHLSDQDLSDQDLSGPMSVPAPGDVPEDAREDQDLDLDPAMTRVDSVTSASPTSEAGEFESERADPAEGARQPGRRRRSARRALAGRADAQSDAGADADADAERVGRPRGPDSAAMETETSVLASSTAGPRASLGGANLVPRWIASGEDAPTAALRRARGERSAPSIAVSRLLSRRVPGLAPRTLPRWWRVLLPRLSLDVALREHQDEASFDARLMATFTLDPASVVSEAREQREELAFARGHSISTTVDGRAAHDAPPASESEPVDIDERQAIERIQRESEEGEP